MKPDAAYACSKKCRYVIVSNKLSGPKSDTRRFALLRDGYKCAVCGFDTTVEVHHIIGKRRNGGGGTDHIENLITLCPNHHTMADKGLIAEDELARYIGDLEK
jgi:predicted restriction endonuclease